MIRWQDAPSEPLAKPLAALYSTLAAIDVIAIDARLDASPVVLLTSEARDAARRHVDGRRNEQGGLLLGTPYARDLAAGAIDVVHLRVAVGALDFSSSGVSLRMEAGVWDRARSELREGELVVGWFHSHPGLGAFFSETDRRTQAAFFNHPFSLGWVIDPYAGEEAWFRGGEAEPTDAARVLCASKRTAEASATAAR